MSVDSPSFANGSGEFNQPFGGPVVLGLAPEIVVKRRRWQIVSGYKAPTHGESILNNFEDPDSNPILLVNRDFDEVNEVLNHLPNQAIQARIASGNVPVSVLEIGGGWMSRTALEFVRRYEENVAVTNLDVLLPEDTTHFGPMKAVLGSVTEMPLESESQDVIYSAYTLMYIPRAKLETAFLEIVRVLKPGGQAFLLHSNYARSLLQGNGMQALSERLGVKVASDNFDNPVTGAPMIGPLVFSKP